MGGDLSGAQSGTQSGTQGGHGVRQCDCCCGFYCDCYSSTYCSTCTNCSTYCTTTTSVYNSVPRHRRELHAGESHQIKSLGNMNKYSMYVQYILAQPASMTSMQVDCNPLYTGTPSSSSAKTTRQHHTSTIQYEYSTSTVLITPPYSFRKSCVCTRTVSTDTTTSLDVARRARSPRSHDPSTLHPARPPGPLDRVRRRRKELLKLAHRALANDAKRILHHASEVVQLGDDLLQYQARQLLSILRSGVQGCCVTWPVEPGSIHTPIAQRGE